MYREIKHTAQYASKHPCDEPTSLVELNGCGNRGEVKETSEIGMRTKREPCEDCKDNGASVKNSEWKWVKS